MTYPATGTVAERKAELRSRMAAERAALTTDALAEAEHALLDLAAGCHARGIAAFVPVRGEPGSLRVLDALAQHARVILPITGRIGEPLRWAQYGGAERLVRGPLGLRQPETADGSTLEDVGLVLAPAAAIGRDGTRLGHGGGFYDRALAAVPTERIVAVVHEHELLDTVPHDDHDVPVGWVCTPGGGVQGLGGNAGTRPACCTPSH